MEFTYCWDEEDYTRGDMTEGRSNTATERWTLADSLKTARRGGKQETRNRARRRHNEGK